MLWPPDTCQKEFARIAQREQLAKGVLLDSRNIYYLEAGCCTLGHSSEEGGERILLYFKENSLIGFLPYLIQDMGKVELRADQFAASEYFIKTRSPCQLLKMRGSQLFTLLEKFPRLYKTILYSLTRNYTNIIDLLTRVLNRPAAVRVCRIIEEFKEKEKGGDQLVLAPYLTYYDISIFTNLHVITVTKIFRALLREGIIVKRGRTVVIANEEAIRAIVDEGDVLCY